MRFSKVVRASDSRYRSRNCPGFDVSILRRSRIWRAADETVLNKVPKNPKNPTDSCCLAGCLKLIPAACLGAWCCLSEGLNLLLLPFWEMNDSCCLAGWLNLIPAACLREWVWLRLPVWKLEITPAVCLGPEWLSVRESLNDGSCLSESMNGSCWLSGSLNLTHAACLSRSEKLAPAACQLDWIRHLLPVCEPYFAPSDGLGTLVWQLLPVWKWEVDSCCLFGSLNLTRVLLSVCLSLTYDACLWA